MTFALVTYNNEHTIKQSLRKVNSTKTINRIKVMTCSRKSCTVLQQQYKCHDLFFPSFFLCKIVLSYHSSLLASLFSLSSSCLFNRPKIGFAHHLHSCHSPPSLFVSFSLSPHLTFCLSHSVIASFFYPLFNSSYFLNIVSLCSSTKTSFLFFV